MKQCYFSLVTIGLILCFACKEKKTGEQNDNTFIPVLSIIKGQINDIDTSLYSIIRVNYKDDIPVDTEYIRREEVRSIAKDFLDLPLLSKKNYTEENIPGPTESLSTISYKPIHPDKEQVQRVDIIIDPGLAESGQNVIKSIFIDRAFSNRDSAIEKKMLWHVDQSFQVTTFRQYKGLEETVSTFKVIWNGDLN